MSIYDKASLVLIPSGTKTSKVYSQKPVNGDGDFTFSRSTAATRVNADGNIEKETQNLLLQSNSFNTSPWGSGDGLTGGQTGYDGSNDAWLFNYVTNPAIVSCSNTNGGVQTYSVYAKGNTNNGLRLYAFGSSNCFGYFDLNAGSVEVTQNLIDATIEDKGNGWYRCAITFNQTNTQLYMYLSNNQNSNAGSGSIYIQDAQLNQGLIAQEVITTTTAAVEGGITDNVPRLDYTDSSCPALLLEPQRTNLVSQSEYFSASSWSEYVFGGASLTRTFGYESPEGNNNAYKFDVVVGTGGVLLTDNITINPANAQTLSVWMKGENGGEKVLLALRNSGSAGASGDIMTLTSEWARYDVTLTTAAADRGFQFRMLSSNGVVDQAIYVYGAQLEEGSYATSYIPTYGTSVTRNQDNCNVDSVSNVPTAYPFVLNLEAHHTLNTTTGGLGFYDNSNQYYYYAIQLGSNNKIVVESRPEGVTQNILSSSSTYTEGFHKIAVLFENDTTMKLYINGELQGTKNDCVNNSFNTGFSDYVIGVYRSINTNPCSIRNVKIFNNALSNEELIDLTT